MEHIHQFDWCSTKEEAYFLNEHDLDNCVIEKILRNKFHDPLISSESEEENKPHKVDWDAVFFGKKKNHSVKQRVNVPGQRGIPPYPKLSSLTCTQHYQCMKILCSNHPKILEADFIAPPTKQDKKVFESIKAAYEKEQEEYLEWAKELWINDHCTRALIPDSTIETVYEAEFKMKAHAMMSFPKTYELAAQIPLESMNNKCNLMHQNDILTVSASKLAQIEVPDMTERQFSVMSLYTTPKPCSKHPCRFVLPNEKSMTIFPLTEVNRELAQFAMDHNSMFIASESAVKNLMMRQSSWRLPVSVCEAIAAGGETCNVLVLSDSIPQTKQSAQKRTYRALTHLVHNALIPLEEKRRVLDAVDDDVTIDNLSDSDDLIQPSDLNICSSSSDDEDRLTIDMGDDFEVCAPKSKKPKLQKIRRSSRIVSPKTAPVMVSPKAKCASRTQKKSISNDDEISIYKCTCEESLYGRPPPRSYKKWNVISLTHKENYNMIIHCPHKTKDGTTEVLLEPIVEYQIDLGGTKQSEDTLRSLALSLFLRQNATILNTRIDGPTGDLVTVEPLSLQDIKRQQPDCIEEAANILYTLINQLQGLLPGHYVLEHEPRHGANAFLYTAKTRAVAAQKLQLMLDHVPIAEVDEAKEVKIPPALTNVLLPYHKFRKILPLAFTPHQRQVVKERKKPTPPSKPEGATYKIVNGKKKWPKKKAKKKKKKSKN